MDQNSQEHLLLNRLYCVCSPSQDDLLALARLFRPLETQFDLLRIGPEADGGYLVPNDLDGISACFSPGVADLAGFEDDLFERFGIKSYMTDKSSKKNPSIYNKELLYKWLGPFNSDDTITLPDWIRSTDEGRSTSDLLLQMDIEGAEYLSLLAADDYTISRFRVMVIEFHNLDVCACPEFYKIVDATLKKLSRTHIVVHGHVNNWGGIVKIGEVEYPRVIESTFLRRDRVINSSSLNAATVPNILDRKNGPMLPDLFLPIAFR